jgi:protein TilB
MGGAGITEEMIRRRSEHNECVLYTLEELVLQEEGIERIDTLGILCPHLRILYMPNNLIACLENMNRLKELQYLNLAMNNIVKVCVAYHLLC